MGERQGFFLYHDDIQALEPLTDEQRGKLLRALVRFSAFHEQLETDDALLKVAFNLMSAKITRDADKYEKKCEKNRKNILQRYDRIPSNTTVNERVPKTTNVYERIGSNTTVNERIRTLPTVTETGTVTETATVNNVSELYPRGIPPTPFIPPTLEDVDEFCEAQGIDVDPVRFVMYYTARGWKMGTTPMTDWKAAVRLWEQRDKADAQKQTPAPIDDDEPVNWYEG